MSTSKKVNNLSNSYKNDKEKLAQAHFSKGGLAHGQKHGSGSHGGGKGNGNGKGGHGGQRSQKKLTCVCGKVFVPRMPIHTFCSVCYKHDDFVCSLAAVFECSLAAVLLEKS